MDANSLIGMSLICVAGAVSPGPSLALVVRNTINRGRTQGIMTGIGHGIGLGIYAFIAVTGLSTLLLASDNILKLIQILGAILLMWLSFNMVKRRKLDENQDGKDSGMRGFIEGFLIAFLNPKIFVFLVAVFSQFINSSINNYDRFLMAGIAGIIDTTWYVLVAVVLAETSIPEKLRQNSAIVDRVIGIVLLIFSIILIYQLIN